MTLPDGLGTEPDRREPSVTLAGLQCFVAVMDSGSLSRAAQLLGLSQPTVSVHLATLERACGTLLLHRKPRLVLTDAGRDLLVRARLVLSRFDEFEGSVRDLRGLRRGSLAIGLSTPAFAMPLVAQFMAAHPQISVRTQLGNTEALLKAISACQVEVAVMTLIEPVEDLACTLIARQRLAACFPKRRAPSAITLTELAQAPLILRERGSMTRAMLERAMVSAGLVPRVALEVGSREAVREAVASGIGVGVLLDGELGGDGRIIGLPVGDAAMLGGVYAVALPESLDIPTVTAFIAIGGLAFSRGQRRAG